MHPSHFRCLARAIRIALATAVPACLFTASAEANNVAWRMIVVPDTQLYTISDARTNIFKFTTQWIVNNKNALNIGLVLNVGDIVEVAGSDANWQRAKSAYAILDGQLPYVLTTGNHDYGTFNAENWNTKFNDYFKATDNPLNDPAQGGILRGTKDPDRLENAYYEYIAPDGRKLMITALEWSPRNAAVTWANGIAGLPQYQDHTAVLTTHAYLYYDDTRYNFADKTRVQFWNPYYYPTANNPDGVNDGEDLWRKLIRDNPNFQMVFSGHVLNDQVARLTSLNNFGLPVHQMLYNAQLDPNGGDGWVRMLEFLDDGVTVNVRTISPWLASLGQTSERLSDDHRFSLTLSPIIPVPVPLPGDLDGDGFVGVTDLNIVLSAWNGSTPPGGVFGDPTGDGFVGIADLNLVLSNWNTGTLPPAVALDMIPEPSTLSLCGGAAIYKLVAQRRSRNRYERALGF